MRFQTLTPLLWRSALAAAALLMPACDVRSPTWREYEEYTSRTAPPHTHRMPAGGPGEPAAQPGPLKWSTPAGWRQQAATGMRIASFHIESSSRTGLCTIIQLGGAAGGVDANVRRWIDQIGQPEPAAGDFDAFLSRQERFKSEGGLDCTMVDLTTLGDQGPDQDSMLGAIFPMGGVTAFMKFTGPVALLKEQRAAFAGLCRSITRGDQ